MNDGRMRSTGGRLVAAFLLTLWLALPAIALTVYGTSGNDSLYGTSGVDDIYGNGGSDWIAAYGGSDRGGVGTGGLFGGYGSDEMYAGSGQDGLNHALNPGDCDGSTDYLNGQGGEDVLVAWGCNQKDYLYGGSQWDICDLDYVDYWNSCQATTWH